MVALKKLFLVFAVLKAAHSSGSKDKNHLCHVFDKFALPDKQRESHEHQHEKHHGPAEVERIALLQDLVLAGIMKVGGLRF